MLTAHELSAITAAMLMLPSLAAAQEIGGTDAIARPQVSITIDSSCAGIDPEIVRRVLGVELGSEADLDAPLDRATTHVLARCDEAQVVLELDELMTGKRLARTIDLTATPEDGRARLVALAMAELIAASWIELAMRHDPEVDAVDGGGEGAEEARAIALRIATARLPVTVEEETPVARIVPPRVPPLGIRAIGVARVSGEPFHFSGGGGLAMDLELLGPLAILLDVRAEQGSVDAGELGSVTLTAAWAGALLALRLPLGLHHADLGVGVRGGIGWLDGEGMRGVLGSQQVGPVGGVITATHLSLHIAYAAYLHVGIELGWITLPLYGTVGTTGESVARIGGAQMAITLGFEVRPE